MDRLTGRDGEHAYILKCFDGEAGCDNMDTSKCDFCPDGLIAICEKLAHFEDLQEQGRLVVLPCKVGDTVYVNRECLFSVMTYGNNHSEPCEVIAFVKTKKQTLAKITTHKAQAENRRYSRRFPISAFGKTVFLTHAEAQAALDRMEGQG